MWIVDIQKYDISFDRGTGGTCLCWLSVMRQNVIVHARKSLTMMKISAGLGSVPLTGGGGTGEFIRAEGETSALHYKGEAMIDNLLLQPPKTFHRSRHHRSRKCLYCEQQTVLSHTTHHGKNFDSDANQRGPLGVCEKVGIANRPCVISNRKWSLCNFNVFCLHFREFGG